MQYSRLNARTQNKSRSMLVVGLFVQSSRLGNLNGIQDETHEGNGSQMDVVDIVQ
jgi:hypothetical protein